tara:strand:+ start:253 stop:420 length:168 start_codon:yes stop_codon:yes gene_type:complete
MGYKIPDLKEDLTLRLLNYLDRYEAPFTFTDETKQCMQEDIEDIIDEKFKKILYK